MALIVRRSFPAIAAVGALIVLTLFPFSAAADRPPSDASFIGTYKGVAVEIRQDPGLDVEYCHIVVSAVADGHGNISLDGTRRCSLSGTFHDVDTGTYSVSPDGLILFAFDSGDGGKGIIGDKGAIVIIDNFSADPTNPVLAFTGVVARVF